MKVRFEVEVEMKPGAQRLAYVEVGQRLAVAVQQSNSASLVAINVTTPGPVVGSAQQWLEGLEVRT